MGGKNNFLRMIAEAKTAGFEAGLKSGRQQIVDMLSLVLNDKEIMKKDVFGKDRLVDVVNGIYEYIDTYQKAWLKDDETDYYRAKMDEALAKIYGDGLQNTFSFCERYEFAPEYDYNTGKWK